MSYALGVDLGTTFTAAAVARDGRVEMVTLGDHTDAVPSAVVIRPDGTVLTGDAAERRAATEPELVAREVKRRLGDPMPLILGGAPYPAAVLIAHQLRDVVGVVSDREGGPPEMLTLTHPANWGPYKREQFAQIPHLAGVDNVRMLTEPEAAAAHYARNEHLAVGALVAVYDLGGGTFDATVLRTTEDGFVILGRPEGIEGLGGVDFDEAVFSHVDRTLDGTVSGLDLADARATSAAIRLRHDCVRAKEALSADTETTIPVLLPHLQTEVRLTCGEFETMIRPSIAATIASLRRALRSARVDPAQLATVLLVGGSSRIPLVARTVSAELGRPTAVDAHPKHAVALGAAALPPAHPTGPAGAAPDVAASRADTSTGPGDAAPRVLAGRYELRGLIGRGGMAEVHRALDRELGRTVAVKLLPAEHRGDAEFGGRLRDEARAAAVIDHPHVVAVYDVGFADGGEVFVVMEWVDGRTLREELRERGRLPVDEAAAVLVPVCEALAAAHERGVVHRDVNPANIMRCRDGTVKLMDFGIARVGNVEGVTGSGVVMGTAAYLSPEQVRCDPLDGRSDLYAVGCTLYELLTGQVPFRGPSAVEVASRRLHEPPVPPRELERDLSPELDAVVLRALALDPARRHQNAHELADDLRRSAAPDPVLHTEVITARGVDDDGRAGAGAPGPRRSAAGVPRRLQALLGGRQRRDAEADTGARQPHRRRLPLVIALIALIAALAGGGTAAYGALGAPVHTEPVLSPGANPFMPPVGTDTAGVTSPIDTGHTVPGDTSGLYGGTLNESTCDPDKMVAFLQAHPDRAAAWAGVEGIRVADIPSYAAGLTPLILRTDTAVTNHGFADGRATTLDSVLQAGTAVLVDDFGVPRVRCECGNPLTPPVVHQRQRFTGPSWPAFSRTNITVVQAASVVITEFVIVDVDDVGQVISRPAGSRGYLDRLRPPPAAAEPRPEPPTVTRTPPAGPPSPVLPGVASPTEQSPAQSGTTTTPSPTEPAPTGSGTTTAPSTTEQAPTQSGTTTTPSSTERAPTEGGSPTAPEVGPGGPTPTVPGQ
ncbi:DUF6777 domain-containing protein [Actinomycetospora cinnamomea]|uniref:DUF6777 domain-containing protein n=1 Tax=Actinomycetospora cinnamomea TaxID=663609 RepID=UPI000E30CC67|nr:DUF6777 domain-containing protein [Actinomycetospora cinnamomea]